MAKSFLPLNENLSTSLSAKIVENLSGWLANWFQSDFDHETLATQLNIEVRDKSDSDKSDLNKALASNQVVNKVIQFDDTKSSMVFSLSLNSLDALLKEQTGMLPSVVSSSKANLNSIIEKSLVNFWEEVFASTARNVADSLDDVNDLQIVEGDLSTHTHTGFNNKTITVALNDFSMVADVPNELLLTLLAKSQMSSTETSSEETLVERKSLFLDEPVSFGVDLTGFKLRVGELATLQVGDVITAKTNKADQIKVTVNNQIKEMECRLGKVNDKVCVRFN